jgi:hypothetical protein
LANRNAELPLSRSPQKLRRFANGIAILPIPLDDDALVISDNADLYATPLTSSPAPDGEARCPQSFETIKIGIPRTAPPPESARRNSGSSLHAPD